MRLEMRNKVVAFLRNERGETIIEYVMIGFLVTMVLASLLLA